VVLQVCCDGSELFSGVVATRGRALLQPTSLGEAGGLRHPVRVTLRARATAREKVKSRLTGDLDPSHWDLPPKPKWMRWHTYECLTEKYQFQQGKIDQIFAHYVGG